MDEDMELSIPLILLMPLLMDEDIALLSGEMVRSISFSRCRWRRRCRIPPP